MILGSLYGLLVLFKSQKQVIGKKIKYTFNQEDILIETEQGSTSLNYYSIINCKQSQNVLLLYISKKQAYIVDKTQLSPECLEHIEIKIEAGKLVQDNL